MVAAVLLGLTCGVKWSGLWFVVAFGLLTVLWDLGLRRSLGVAHPWRTTLLRDALPTAVLMVGIVFVVYLATWTGWFLTDTGYYRDWAASAVPAPSPVCRRPCARCGTTTPRRTASTPR